MILGADRPSAEPQRVQMTFSRSHSKLGQSQVGPPNPIEQVSAWPVPLLSILERQKVAFILLGNWTSVETENGVKLETCMMESG